MHKGLLLLLAGTVGLTAGWWYTENVLTSEPVANTPDRISPDDILGQRRPDFSIGSTTGEVLQAADFDGTVVLINFWATWCEPCREEMPMLGELHEQWKDQGFAVLGVALDDVAQARGFLEDLGIEYPNAVGGVDVMAMAATYGNRAGLLPYSVLIDREGIVRYTELGELHRQDIEAEVKKLL